MKCLIECKGTSFFLIFKIILKKITSPQFSLTALPIILTWTRA